MAASEHRACGPLTNGNSQPDLVMDIVEDSEPEREDARRREKENRKIKKQKQLKASDALALIMSSPLNGTTQYLPGMQMGSQSEMARTSKKARAVLDEKGKSEWQKTIIEIDDDALPRLSSTELHSVGSAALNNQGSNLPSQDLRFPEPEPEPTPTDAISISSSESDIEASDRLKLGRFGLPGTSNLKSTKIRVASARSTSVADSDKSTRPSHWRPPHRFTTDFTNTELGKILTCVSCQLKWTTRKSVTQKMLHIQTCAKKNRLTDETVKILIRRELNKVSSESANGAEAAGGAMLSKAQEPETYLEDLLGTDAPRKKGKRPEARGTLQSVTQARVVIRDRARLFLGHSSSANSDEDDNGAVVTALDDHMAGPPADGVQTTPRVPPSTQAFGPSKLSRPQRPPPSSVNGHDMVDRTHINQRIANSRLETLSRPKSLFDADLYTTASGEDVPAATQPFGLSNSGKANSPPDALAGGSESFARMPSPGCSSAEARFDSHKECEVGTSQSVKMCLPTAADSSSRSERELHLTPRSKARHLHGSAHVSPDRIYSLDDVNNDDVPSQGDSDGVGWRDDDAILHFDPSWSSTRDGPNPMQLPREERMLVSTTDYLGRKKRINPMQAITTNKPVTSASLPLRIPNVPPKSARKGKSRAVQESPDDECDIDKLEAQLKSLISQDKVLHLRILRYEPLHYDIFVQMLSEQGIPTRGIKLKLRKCLDRLAINFYGAEPGGSRSRY